MGHDRVRAQGVAQAWRCDQWYDLGLVALGAVVCGLVVGLAEGGVPLGALRIALGLATVLFAPGYALQAALFPRNDALDGPERLGLAFGLSVAVVPVLALVLDQLPWGIRLWPIVVGEGSITLACAALAAWRRGRLPAGERFRPEVQVDLRGWWAAQDRTGRVLYGVLAGALLVAAGSAVAIALLPTPGEFYTEFYILGAGGLAEEYPREAAVGEELAVTAGITNREREALTYRVEVWAVDPWSGEGSQEGAAGPLRLEPGETWEAAVGWRMPQAGEDQQVQFLLFREGDEEPYRSLRLWLDVTEAGP